MESTAYTRQEHITLSEIALLKCVKAKDYRKWLDTYGNEPSNPFISKAKDKYDETYFNERYTLSGFRSYLKKFPVGKYREEAKLKVQQLERDKHESDSRRGELVEQVGYAINLCIFFLLLFGPMIAEGWGIGETFALAASFTPIYYGIYTITRNRKK